MSFLGSYVVHYKQYVMGALCYVYITLATIYSLVVSYFTSDIKELFMKETACTSSSTDVKQMT